MKVKENERPVVWEEWSSINKRLYFIGDKGQTMQSLKWHLGRMRTNCEIYPEMNKCKNAKCNFREKCICDYFKSKEGKEKA